MEESMTKNKKKKLKKKRKRHRDLIEQQLKQIEGMSVDISSPSSEQNVREDKELIQIIFSHFFQTLESITARPFHQRSK